LEFGGYFLIKGIKGS